MRRVDVPQSEGELLQLFKEDPIGRRDDVEGFLHTLESIESGFTFFLDEGWGEGKTVFARQVELILRGLNPSSGDTATAEVDFDTLVDVSADSPLRSYLPVYYNAWENDYWDDPLPSLGASIASASSLPFSPKEEHEDAEIVTSAFDAVLKSLNFGIFNLGGVAEVRQALSGADLIEDYKNRSSLREKVSELIEAALPEHANKMLLIIDELDRCRPVFALKVLEEIKNLFTSDNLVILCAVNVSQLAKTVEGVYGQGTDGERYLERFCDTKIRLTPASSEQFLAYRGLRNSSYFYDSISIEAISNLAPSLRTLSKLAEELKAKRDESNRSIKSGSESIISFAEAGLVPLLICLKHCKPNDYRSLCSGEDTGELMKLVDSSEQATDFYSRMYSDLVTNQAIEEAEEKEVYEKQKADLIASMATRMVSSKVRDWPEGCKKIESRCWVNEEDWDELRKLVCR